IFPRFVESHRTSQHPITEEGCVGHLRNNCGNRKTPVDNLAALSVYSFSCLHRLSAGQGGLSLFDNRYDVPESVRTVCPFRAQAVWVNRATLICLVGWPSGSFGGHFFCPTARLQTEV